MKKNNIKWKDIKIAIDNKNKIDILKQQKEELEKEIQSILSQRNYLLKTIKDINTM